jgi:large subunit ribosomal protein L21
MYAVIRSGGKQHRIEPGKTLKVERLDAEVGKKIELGEVLMVADKGKVTLGDPVVASARVRATVLDQDRARKIIVFKKKRKKQYRRTRGHRQPYTELRVDEIKL